MLAYFFNKKYSKIWQKNSRDYNINMWYFIFYIINKG